MLGEKKPIPSRSFKIPKLVSAKRLSRDMGFYLNEAIRLGATDAVILKTNKLPVDERAVLKCQIPRCLWYGTCANCPPYALPVKELIHVLKMYELALFFKKEVDSQIIVRKNSSYKERINAYRSVFNIVGAIESKAFYDGYYFAMGFSAGSCRSYLCSEHRTCMALKLGQVCRFPNRARSSMEAVGFDVFKLCTIVGWQVYPIGSNCPAELVPHGTLMGLVLIR